MQLTKPPQLYEKNGFYHRTGVVTNVLRGLYSKAASDDCVDSDTKSHLKCWVLMKRYLQQKDSLIESHEIEDIRRKI